GDGFGTDLRAELHFAADTQGPRLDLAAVVDETAVPVAGLFWVPGKMPERAIEWLDRGLLDGRVTAGRAVIGGELGHWPFRDGSGRFDAHTRVLGARVDFHHEWPAVEALDVDVWFDGPAMGFENGAGRLLGNRVEHFTG